MSKKQNKNKNRNNSPDNKNITAQELETKAEELKETARELEEKAEELKENAQEKAEELKGNVQEKAGELKGNVQEKAGELKENAQEKVQELQAAADGNLDALKELEQKGKKKGRGIEIFGVFAKHNFYANGLTPEELRTTLEWKIWDRRMSRSVRSCPAVWIFCRRATARNWRSCVRTCRNWIRSWPVP